MSKAVIFFAPGLEECEGLVTVDLLRRAGIEVQICAVAETLQITGSHNITVTCDALARDADLAADAVILPGGLRGTNNLAASDLVKNAVLSYHAYGKVVAAICAAPSVLGGLQLLAGRHATCYPGFEEALTGAICEDAEAVTDGNIITASGLGAAIPFALAIIARLEGAAKAHEIKKQIIYRH